MSFHVNLGEGKSRSQSILHKATARAADATKGDPVLSEAMVSAPRNFASVSLVPQARPVARHVSAHENCLRMRLCYYTL